MVIEGHAERATRGGEIFKFIEAMYLLGRLVAAVGLAVVMWQLALIVERAAQIYRTCGFIYYEVEAYQLPRCMREFVDQRYWLDLVK